ncbi:MAG: sulfate adenylyltransferase subunit CysN [Weeksellaceae bacterium]
MTFKNRELLRLYTAGSVDDGKSTLIGRLLYDAKAILQDQLNAIELSSKKRGLAHLDLSLLTDGLKDERAQGITIDVAYRYFATPKRTFIIADTPGHIQYTRNMVTGASTANLAIILIDVRKGLTEQTKRHAFIASLLQIPHIIVCINKMDLVDYNEEAFDAIVSDYESFSAKLSVKDIRYIPISALHGDNVVDKSEAMNWYQGRTLLNTLETIHISSDRNYIDMRFPVQTVIRPHTTNHHDFRGYAGRINSGTIRVGDEVTILPSGQETIIQSIVTYDGKISEAHTPMSITVTLADDIDVSRGDMLVKVNNKPHSTQQLDVMLCWLHENPPLPRAKYYLRHTTREVKAMIQEVIYKIDVNTLHKIEDVKVLHSNDIARVRIKTTEPIFIDTYKENRNTGSIILIDTATNETVAAGMVK